MTERLDAALDVVPELAEHGPALRELFDAVGAIGSGAIQRVHGDLHLGQTLRTAKGWKIVDFEGEPAKPLSERVAARLARGATSPGCCAPSTTRRGSPR